MSDKTKSMPTAQNESSPELRRNALHEVTSTSFGLGIVLGVFLGSLTMVTLKNLNAYMIALCIFHFFEYYVTARYNPSKVTKDSYLLNNGSAYILCHTIAVVECVVEYIFIPKFSVGGTSRFRSMIIIVGYIFIIMGQTIRSLAMITAGESFSHTLQIERQNNHTLIKGGIYQWLRHPSYFGFFWWALGSQMILLNPISFILFAVVLWKFFNDRINVEEAYLIKFFGEDYIAYRNSVVVGIPFIR